ncbi:hypothetical protein BAJUN_02710 [Bajunvirus bajun]|uniref:Uncharacterized protein n=1 Tax=Brevundimonas phage vB_BgoS-Bajun TaxID=2948594 RepID=A0A9E7N7H3_9CAUD|nr:hypothetical protein BAJUN_02710 [Brevundimonas phage vB_BgoS-Bajun]
MNEHDMLRQVLEQQALALVGPLNMKLVLDNDDFVQPKDGKVWSEFWFETGKTTATTGGGAKGWERTSGVLQFTLKCPENTGNGPLLKVAAAIKRAFNRKQWNVPPEGYVSLDPVSVQAHGKPMGGLYHVIVDATFWFHHRDTAAPEFYE